MNSIIFVNRYFYPDQSATSQLLSDLAFHLAEKEQTVKVIASRQLYDKNDQSLAPEETVKSVIVKRVWTSKFGRQNLFGRAFDYLTFYLSAFFILMKEVL